jgi:hypothetical protein
MTPGAGRSITVWALACGGGIIRVETKLMVIQKQNRRRKNIVLFFIDVIFLRKKPLATNFDKGL